MSTAKDAVTQAVDGIADELEALSRRIHDHPGAGLRGSEGRGLADRVPRRQGLQGRAGVAGVDTAFRATIETGDGPTIAILCEYDALPGIGHACGHNVIATSGAGAGAALAAVRRASCRRAASRSSARRRRRAAAARTLIKGGRLQGRGLRHDDPRLRPHASCIRTSSASCAGPSSSTGKAAHASADPWEGVNALDACIETFNAVSMLRQQVRPDCRIHGIITNGGAAANIIPEFAAAVFYVRAPRIDVHVGAVQARGGLRGGRGQGDGRHAEGDAAGRQRLRADEAEPDPARSLRRAT